MFAKIGEYLDYTAIKNAMSQFTSIVLQ